MQEEDGHWLENNKGIIWFKRYIMLNAMNTIIILIIYIYFLYVLLGDIGSAGDLPDYVLPVAVTLVTVIVMVAVLSVWIRIITLRKFMPVKVGIDNKGITWKSSTGIMKVPWRNLNRTDPVKYEKEKIVEGIVTGLLKPSKVGRDVKPTGSAFYRWVLKRLMIDDTVVDGIKEGYDMHLLSKG